MILALINGLGDRNFLAGERSPLLYFYYNIDVLTYQRYGKLM